MKSTAAERWVDKNYGPIDSLTRGMLIEAFNAGKRHCRVKMIRTHIAKERKSVSEALKKSKALILKQQ